LQLDDVKIKHIGFSRQKILYARTLAQSIIAGQIDLSSLSTMNDDKIRTVTLLCPKLAILRHYSLCDRLASRWRSLS